MDANLTPGQLNYRRHRERRLAEAKAYYRANKAKVLARKRMWQRKHRLGVSKEEFLGMWFGQRFRCAICGRGINLSGHIDYDHMTGHVRGLLCSTCNQGLGLFRDDPRMLLSASRYLREHC